MPDHRDRIQRLFEADVRTVRIHRILRRITPFLRSFLRRPTPYLRRLANSNADFVISSVDFASTG